MCTNRRRSELFGAFPLISVRQDKPGASTFARRQARQRICERSECGLEIFELCSAEAHTLERLREGLKYTPQRRIGGERSEERLGGDEVGCGAFHLVEREEKNPVAFEELTAVGADGGADHVAPSGDGIHRGID